MALGRKTGGRVKGTLNRPTVELAQKLDAIGCDAVRGMAIIAMGRVPCIYCDESGHGTDNEPCAKCGGTGTELVSIDIRARMFTELAQYVLPKRRAIEHTGDDGGPLLVTTINVVRPLALPKPESGGG